MSDLIRIQNEEDKKSLLEQYKTVIDSISKLNDIRESSNGWWIGINGALTGAISYFRNIQELEGPQKQAFLWTIIIIGLILCYSWLSSILTIKRDIDKRNNMLFEFEKFLPAKTFTFAILDMERDKKKNSLSLKEAIVPILFLIGYMFFAVMLYFYPGFSAAL